MKLSMRWHFFVLCFCIVFSAKAQWTLTKNATIHDFELRATSGLYKAIITDEYGYTWIASDNAIYRYDGQHITTFNRQTASRFLKDFYHMANGDLVVLHDEGLVKITTAADTAYFETLIPGSPEKDPEKLFYPKTVFEDKKGQLWISESQSVVQVNGDGLTRHEFGDQDVSVNYLRSISIVEDGYGNLWAMTYTGNLFRFDLKTQQFQQLPLNRKVTRISALECQGDDQLIFGSAEGVFTIQTNQEGTVQTQPRLLIDVQDVSNLLPLEGQMLIGTWNDGLYLHDQNQPGPIQLSDLPFNDVIDLHKTEYGIWVMGSDRISLVSAPVFNVYEKFGIDERIESIIAGLGNELVVTAGNELAFIDNSFKGLTVKRTIAPENSFYVSCLALKDDRLWIGTGRGTVSVMDVETGLMTPITTTVGSNIKSLITTPDGNVWACGNDRAGIIRIAPDGTIEEFNSPDLYDANIIEVIGSEVFVGGKGQQFLHRWDAAKEAFLHLDFRLADGSIPEDLEVNDLNQDQNGLYLATSQGLFYIAERSQLSGTMKRVDLGNYSEVSLGTVAIAQDSALWMASDNGLGILKSYKGQQILFNENNGLPSRMINAGGIFLDDYQNVLVATVKGIGYIYNDSRLDLTTPQPFIVKVMENGVKQDLQGPYQFSFNSLIQIDYLTPSFPATSTDYRYRLKERSDQWSESDPLGKISLYDLRPGDYVLEFQARQESGYTWSESQFMNFTISTPWHQKAWVRLLLALIFIVLLYLLIKLFNRRLINRTKNLEALIAQKAEQIDSHKQEIIAQQEELLGQKEELIVKNQRLFETSSALDKAEIKYREVTQTQLEAELEFKNKQLTTHALHLLQKNKSLEDLSTRISALLKEDTKQLPKGLRSLRNQIDTSIKSDRVWDEFKLYFEQIYSGFYSKLKLSFPELSSNDLKHCALMKLNLNNDEASSLFGVSPETVRVSRFRIQKKLGLNSQQALIEFLMKI